MRIPLSSTVPSLAVARKPRQKPDETDGIQNMKKLIGKEGADNLIIDMQLDFRASQDLLESMLEDDDAAGD